MVRFVTPPYIYMASTETSFSFYQQSEYEVIYKLMCWVAGSLTCRLISVMRSPPARRSRKFNHDWFLAPHRWGFYIIHNDAPHSVGLLWTSGHSVAETSTWQHTTLTTDRHPCPRWDSNPRSQQASGRKTYALDCAATGTGRDNFTFKFVYSLLHTVALLVQRRP